MRFAARAVLPLLALLAAGCVEAFRIPAPSWPPLPDGHFMHVGTFLQVSGTAKLPPGMTGETQRRAEGRDAAIMDAWERLQRYLESLPLPEGGTVGERCAASGPLQTSLVNLVRSSELVSTEFAGDRVAAVLRLDKTRINRFLGTQFRRSSALP
ncbi:MAG: hypothetical protein A2X36_10425 [Elusimicrobia bacterium GWA2_69_24]|nr:MAG: hypothetical protein A2X36_10425 [Elusimicrobia bacterium GWA2_69_24]HBL18267.1 hypothetical protein [Elusimicrobiota bacterium]